MNFTYVLYMYCPLFFLCARCISWLIGKVKGSDYYTLDWRSLQPYFIRQLKCQEKDVACLFDKWWIKSSSLTEYLLDLEYWQNCTFLEQCNYGIGESISCKCFDFFFLQIGCDVNSTATQTVQFIPAVCFWGPGPSLGDGMGKSWAEHDGAVL